jgi:CO/xanthine dehydrogenase Mo-binding subunit
MVCRGIATSDAVDMVLSKFQRDENGLYFNKRLETEAKKRAEHSEKQRLRAKKGWEKRKKQRHSRGNATAYATAMPLENENESEDVNRVIDEDKGGDYKEGETELWPTFDDFWTRYDKKVDRAKCEKAWKRLKQQEKEECMEHLRHYIRATPDKQFRRNPLTYLNNEGWTSEIIRQGKQATGQKTAAQMAYEALYPAGRTSS